MVKSSFDKIAAPQQDIYKKNEARLLSVRKLYTSYQEPMTRGSSTNPFDNIK